MEDERKWALSGEFWVSVVAVTLTLGAPALLWAGSIGSRVDAVEKKTDEARMEIREDLREINRKLDELRERIK